MTALDGSVSYRPRSRGRVTGFWIATALFCLQMGFTAYAQLRVPQVAAAFTHLGDRYGPYQPGASGLSELLGEAQTTATGTGLRGRLQRNRGSNISASG